MPDLPQPIHELLTGTATPHTWMGSISAVLASDWFSNTWSVESGSACRVVFTFDNGLRLTWVGTGNGDEPELLQAWCDPKIATDYPAGVHDLEPFNCPTPGDWEWNEVTQTWDMIGSPAEAADVITAAVTAHGTPGIVLPWEFLSNDEFVEALRFATPEGKTVVDVLSNLDEYPDAADAWEEAIGNYEEDGAVMAVVFAAAGQGALLAPQEWEGQPCTVTYGDDYVPPFSPLARYSDFVTAMEQHEDWIIVWDECCGTCAGGTIRSMREMRDLPDTAPSLVMFAQNAQYYWQPNGFVMCEFYQSNDDEVAVIVEEATKAGLFAQQRGNEPRVVITAN